VIGLIIAVIYGLSTDYEVFLVSRMIEARERGMSTAEAIRIGTAQTGRIITAAALILMVVGGAFIFSDLVMMKYLAFGLVAALLLDATVVRMFLVPSVMKLLGDDCWWAPRWMRRLQNRIGLGEIELPDERKRSTVREREEALVGAGAPGGAAPSAPPHDPGHPAVEGATRRVATRPARGAPPQPPLQPPSGTGTTRIPTAPRAVPRKREAPPAADPPTTRLTTAAKNAAKSVANNASAITQRTHRAAPPPREDREIESWLGELRGGNPPPPAPPPPSPPAADETTAIPVHRHGKPSAANSPADDTTTAIPARRPDDPDETEKLKAPGKESPRRGGGLSAQELLRREGRI
jgi:hypothetical protein